MELKKLEYLEAIYRLHSFTKAAEEQFISQPSITSAIRKLEAELGTELIDRKSKILAFTSKGERFMEHVYRILEEVGDAVEEIQSREFKAPHSVNLFAASMAGDWFAPSIFTDFLEQNPDYDVILIEDSYDDMLKKLSDGTLDLAFTIFPERFSSYEYETIPLMKCDLVGIISHDHLLADEPFITLEQMEKELLIVPREGTLIRSSFSTAMGRKKLMPTYRSVQQVRISQGIVAQNRGIGLTTSDCQEEVLHKMGIMIKKFDEEITFTKGFMMKKGKTQTQEMKKIINYTKSLIQKKCESQ